MESEQLENTANEALRAIIDNAAAAKEFILAELPEVVQQLLMLRYIAKENSDDNVAIPWGFSSVFITIFGLMVPLMSINMDWLQIYIAPKVYLLEYATSLVK